MPEPLTPPPMTIDPSRTYSCTVSTGRGEFTVELDAGRAPATVNNFVHLAQTGFYEGLTFHRVERGFVVQGGDPLGNGTGGPGYRLPDEASDAPWTKGALGMASNAAGVSGSQFFILLGDAPHLARSGVYNHFGRVISGQDVVESIQVRDKILGITVEVS